MPFPFPPPQGTIPHGLVPDNLRSGVTIDGITGSVNVRDTAVPSTNLVLNSGFEVVTTTATLFSDPLTAYSGSTAAPWTVQNGSFSFSTSGATSGASASLMSGGNSAWKPLLGTDGSTSLPLTAQVSFTQPSAVTGMTTYLVVDSNNQYYASDYGGTFYLFKVANGTAAQLASVAQTIAAASTYTIALALDYQGHLTAKLYSGSGTGGTLLQTLTATDTSLAGGFLLGVGGDTGVVVTDASMTGPMPNQWALHAQAGVGSSWGVGADPAAESGQYALELISYEDLGWAYVASAPVSVTDGEQYTLSFWAKADASRYLSAALQTEATTYRVCGEQFSLTTTWHRFTVTGTAPSGASSQTIVVYLTLGGQDVRGYIDNVQVELGSSATPYIENDLTAVPSTPTAANLLTGAAAFANGAILSGSMANQGSPTFTPSGSAQSLPAGYYSGGTIEPGTVFASGTVTSSSSEMVFADAVANGAKNANNYSAYYVTLNTSFIPSVIVLSYNNSNTNGDAVFVQTKYSVGTIEYNYSLGNGAIVWYNDVLFGLDGTDAYVGTTSRIPVNFASTDYNWFAYE